MELLEQIPQLDAILVSVSGGGLISGISVYAKSVNPGIKIIAVEPEGKRLSESFRMNERNLDHKPIVSCFKKKFLLIFKIYLLFRHKSNFLLHNSYHQSR